jgi:hypothetical protein
MEPLEGRRMLAFSVSFGGGAPLDGNGLTVGVGFSGELNRTGARPLMDVRRLFLGELVVDRSIGGIGLLDNVLFVQLELQRQRSDGLLSGTLSIEGLGTFKVKGVLQRHGRFNLIVDSNGVMSGRIRQSGELLTARLITSAEGRTIAGKMRLFGQDTAAFLALARRIRLGSVGDTIFNPPLETRLNPFDPRVFTTTFGRDRIGFLSPVSGPFTSGALGVRDIEPLSDTGFSIVGRF